MLTPELQKYYEEQFNTMSTEGWKDFLDDMNELKASINDVTLTTDTQDLFFRKGQLDILDLVLSRRKACEQVYDQLKGASQ